MLDKIPPELFTIVRKNLSYENLQNINNVIMIDATDKDMFVNSELFYQNNLHLQKTLEIFDITSDEFYLIVKDSALDSNNIYDILVAINGNHISNKNKYDYNLKINYNKTEYSHIKNTITILKIVMMTMEYHVSNDFIINNPYHYTSINITSILLHYFYHIVKNAYEVVKDIERNSFRFKLMMFECPWYKSDINLYHVFLLYLLNIKVISSQNNVSIYELCKKNTNSKMSGTKKNTEFVSALLKMFQDANYTIQLHQMINSE